MNASSIRETAYATLERIASIEDDNERSQVLRDTLLNNNALAIVIQRVYHPNYNFDLPEGELPESIAAKSGHEEFGPFYSSIKKWDKFRVDDEVASPHISKTNKENQFISLYEGVASSDADLLIAVKDKKLPWETLSKEFVVAALPELFPVSASTERVEAVAQANSTSTESKKETCRRIMQENPNLARKDYLKLFEELGIAPSTGALYYQTLKKEFNA